MQGTYSKVYNHDFLIMSTVWIFEDQKVGRGRFWGALMHGPSLDVDCSVRSLGASLGNQGDTGNSGSAHWHLHLLCIPLTVYLPVQYQTEAQVNFPNLHLYSSHDWWVTRSNGVAMFVISGWHQFWLSSVWAVSADSRSWSRTIFDLGTALVNLLGSARLWGWNTDLSFD